MSSRILALTLATVGVIVSFLGCAGSEPQSDPLTKYSVDSLTKEFAFRYKTVDRSKPSEKPDGVVTKTGAVTKKGAATKAAKADTFDAILADVIAKAGTIPGLSHAQACKQLAEQVAKDATFSAADKTLIAEKLNQVGG